MNASLAVLDDMEQARASLYRLLAAILSHPPTAALLDQLRALPATPDDGPIAAAIAALADAARRTTLQAASTEYDALFVGVARGELMPYASFYLTGFLHDRPLARLRDDLRTLGLVAVPGHPDPEDHAGTLFEIMAWIIEDRHQTLAAQSRFFARHLAPWIDRFFADLQTASAADLYTSVGAVGRAFYDVERLAFQREPS